MGRAPRDLVDGFVEQTRRERPDLDAGAVELLARLTRVGRLVERATSASLEAYGLGLGEFWLLVALRRSGPPFRLAPRELIVSTTATSGAISQQLERLEHRGLVCRRPNPDDRRSVLVELSRSGRGLIDAAWEAHIARDATLLASLSDNQQQQLAGLLRSVLADAERRES